MIDRASRKVEDGMTTEREKAREGEQENDTTSCKIEQESEQREESE